MIISQRSDGSESAERDDAKSVAKFMQNLEMDLPARYPRARRSPDGIGLRLPLQRSSVAWEAATVTVMLCDFHFVDYLLCNEEEISP